MYTPKHLKQKSSNKAFIGIMSLCFILIATIITNTCYFGKPIKVLEVHDEKPTEAIIDTYSETSEYKIEYDFTYLSSSIKVNSLIESSKSLTTENIIESSTEVETSSEIIEEEIIEENEIDIITSEFNIIKTYDVPSGHSFKSYTNYKLLSKSSLQGKLQQQAYTGETGIRMVDDYYCAALGTYYNGNIGDKFLVTLSTGNQFKMILCDVKSDAHTDSKHQYTRSNGCVIEFYVDYSVLSNTVKRMGNISYIDGFEGDIVLIQKIEG